VCGGGGGLLVGEDAHAWLLTQPGAAATSPPEHDVEQQQHQKGQLRQGTSTCKALSKACTVGSSGPAAYVAATAAPLSHPELHAGFCLLPLTPPINPLLLLTPRRRSSHPLSCLPLRTCTGQGLLRSMAGGAWPPARVATCRQAAWQLHPGRQHSSSSSRESWQGAADGGGPMRMSAGEEQQPGVAAGGTSSTHTSASTQ
jgi:hypothetical protein